MYPRLRLARNLMTDDGVIFISIDDNEVHNMRKICDEIFGEDNFVVNNIWVSGRTSAAHFTNSHEYVICYAKDINKLPLFEYNGENNILTDRTIKSPSSKNPLSTIDFPAGIDFECENKIFPLEFGDKEPILVERGIFECENGKLKSPVTLKAAWTMKGMIAKWLDGEEVYDQKGQKTSRFFFKSNGVLQYEKIRGTVHPNSIIKDISTKNGTNELEKLLESNVFQFPKPSKLIHHFLGLLDKQSTILDFFSGSATTAHAVMQLNAQDNGNRKHIMVQLPEPTDEKSQAYRAGYKNITEIGKERIRRAGEQIKSELQEKYDKASEEERKTMKNPNELDIGFKVFKLDSSNIKEWNPGKYDDLQMALEDSLNPYVEGRTEEDVVYEMILKMGLDLTYPVRKHEIDAKTVYSVGYGLLMICLSDNIDVSVAKKMIEIKNDNNLDEFRVIFRDGGFDSDKEKTNVKETLKSAGLADESFITL